MHGKLCCLFIDEVYHNHESFLYFLKELRIKIPQMRKNGLHENTL